uniref:girdin-like n=1 Tax=Pristiophorus japonicus TaxID=55135 RepID=UPI00398F700F
SKRSPEETQPEEEKEEEVSDKMAAPPREPEMAADAKLQRAESVQDPMGKRLIEVERNNATLLAEKGALSDHLRQLETQIDNLQAQILMLQKHTVSLQEQNTSLQTLNTRLQVENTALGSHKASLEAQREQLQGRQASLEAEGKSQAKGQEEARAHFEALLRDHEKLALLHERQEAEFEGLIERHGALKGGLKTLEAEHKELEGRYTQLLAQRTQVEEQEAALRVKRESLAEEGRVQRGLGEAHQKLKEDYDRLSQSHAECGRQQEEQRAQNKAVKGQLNVLQLEKARAEVECGVLREHNQQLDLRWTKLSNQCELLNQLKGNLEEENRHLLHQIQTVTEDNRALLERTVESKDQFHEEQRQYTDKLNELRREKQKLVDKIMDQYRVIDPTMPRRKGNWIADKMKKLIKPRKDLSKEQLRAVFINPASSQDQAEGIVHLPSAEPPDQTPSPSRAAARQTCEHAHRCIRYGAASEDKMAAGPPPALIVAA